MLNKLVIFVVLFSLPIIVDSSIISPFSHNERKFEIPLFNFDGRCLLPKDPGLLNLNRTLEVDCVKYSQVFVKLTNGSEKEVNRSDIKNACNFSVYKSGYIVEGGETRESIIKKFDLIESEVPQNIRPGDVLAICPHSGEKFRAKQAEEQRIEKQINEAIDKRLEDEKRKMEEEFANRLKKELENTTTIEINNTDVVKVENQNQPPVAQREIVNTAVREQISEENNTNYSQQQVESNESQEEIFVEQNTPTKVRQSFPTKIINNLRGFFSRLFRF